jgi:hypothetical protein
MTLASATLARQEMAQVCALMFYLAGLGHFEAFSRATICFYLRHAVSNLSRRQQDRHVAPFHAGNPIGLGDILDLLHDLVDQRPSEFGMGDLPAAKPNGKLNTLPFSDKAPDVLYFEIDIVLFGPRAHLYFFNRAGAGATLGIVRLLFLRVPVFVEVGDAAYGRIRLRRHLHQVKAPAFSDLQGLGHAHDSDLPAVEVDYAYLGRAN